MKICLIAPLFEPWNHGGNTVYINNLAHILSEKHQVLVITAPGPKKRKVNEINPNLRIIELNSGNIAPLYSIRKNQGEIGLAKRLVWNFLDLWNFSYYHQIKKILQSEKPDVVQTNSIKGISPSLFSAVKNQKIPHVFVLHSYESISRWGTLMRGDKPIQFNWLDNIYMSWMRSITANISAVISGSKFTLDFFVKMGFFKNSKKFVIPHGIKLNTDIKPKQGIGLDFMYLGRLEKSKGVQIAIQTFKKVKENNSRFHIVGDGGYFDHLKKLANEDDRIIFYGPRFGKDLVPIFRKCSYGIVPSIWHETFGYINLQFMNEGLPIIGSNMGAIPELIKEGNCGFVYEAFDVESLRKIMQRVVTDEKILSNLSQNAILASKKFSIDNQIKSTIMVYNSVIR